VKTLIDIDIVS